MIDQRNLVLNELAIIRAECFMLNEEFENYKENYKEEETEKEEKKEKEEEEEPNAEE